MSLSSLQLDAFLEVARSGQFSAAAKNLNLTQSALSQRVANLEDALGTALFVRGATGVRLTETGEELIRYCQAKEALEGELLARLLSPSPGSAGVIRIAACSTILRSVVMPALADWIRDNPLIQVELMARELSELPRLLTSGEAELVLLERELPKSGLKSHLIGHEEYVLVEPKGKLLREDTYLDHDSQDSTTETFFRLQAFQPKGYRRSFLDEVYALIDGVAMGWGRAVVPRHLIRGRTDVRIVKGLKPLEIPVILHYFERPYYPRLHQAVVERLLAAEL